MVTSNEGVEPSSSAVSGDRLPVHLSSLTQSSNLPLDEPEHEERDTSDP